MRLFLSSFRLSNEPQKFSDLVCGNKKTAVILNAHDFFPEKERHHLLKEEIRDLEKIGLNAQEIDLRDFFSKPKELEEQLSLYDAVWVPGGDCFLLRRAMYDSGFDVIIKNSLEQDKLVYGGYSAGVVILAPTLQGLDIADDASKVFSTYNETCLYEGLNIISYNIVPHYKSSHGKSEAMDKVVEFFRIENIPYRTLKDGEAIIINGGKEEIIEQITVP